MKKNKKKNKKKKMMMMMKMMICIMMVMFYFVSLNHKTVWWTKNRNLRVVIPRRQRIFTLQDKTDKDRKRE